eukprot:INCI5055.17.p1 GENE.INCI5055.17~~INCI5055.17.p1  ORF type:complete len:3077 (-),score=453.07 INCI5055.17:88-8697(-)
MERKRRRQPLSAAVETENNSPSRNESSKTANGEVKHGAPSGNDGDMQLPEAEESTLWAIVFDSVLALLAACPAQLQQLEGRTLESAKSFVADVTGACFRGCDDAQLAVLPDSGGASRNTIRHHNHHAVAPMRLDDFQFFHRLRCLKLIAQLNERGLFDDEFFPALLCPRFGFGLNADASNRLINGYFVCSETPSHIRLLIQSRGREYKRHIQAVITRSALLSIAASSVPSFSALRMRAVMQALYSFRRDIAVSLSVATCLLSMVDSFNTRTAALEALVMVDALPALIRVAHGLLAQDLRMSPQTSGTHTAASERGSDAAHSRHVQQKSPHSSPGTSPSSVRSAQERRAPPAVVRVPREYSAGSARAKVRDTLKQHIRTLSKQWSDESTAGGGDNGNSIFVGGSHSRLATLRVQIIPDYFTVHADAGSRRLAPIDVESRSHSHMMVITSDGGRTLAVSVPGSGAGDGGGNPDGEWLREDSRRRRRGSFLGLNAADNSANFTSVWNENSPWDLEVFDGSPTNSSDCTEVDGRPHRVRGLRPKSKSQRLEAWRAKHAESKSVAGTGRGRFFSRANSGTDSDHTDDDQDASSSPLAHRYRLQRSTSVKGVGSSTGARERSFGGASVGMGRLGAPAGGGINFTNHSGAGKKSRPLAPSMDEVDLQHLQLLPLLSPCSHVVLLLLERFCAAFPSLVFGAISTEVEAGSSRGLLHVLFALILEPEYRNFSFRVIFRLLAMADPAPRQGQQSRSGGSASAGVLLHSNNGSRSDSFPYLGASCHCSSPVARATTDAMLILYMQVFNAALQAPRSDVHLVGAICMLEQLQQFVAASTSLSVLNHRQSLLVRLDIFSKLQASLAIQNALLVPISQPNSPVATTHGRAPDEAAAVASGTISTDYFFSAEPLAGSKDQTGLEQQHAYTRSLAREVIRTIAVLTVVNTSANIELERQIGLANLETHLLQAEQVPSNELCDILISMLGPNFTDLAGAPSKALIGSFCNVSLMPISLHIAARCPKTLQVRLLTHVLSLLSGPSGLPSLLRAKQLSRPLIDEVLDVLPSLTFAGQHVAIQMLPHIGFNLRVWHLRKIIALMQHVAHDDDSNEDNGTSDSGGDAESADGSRVSVLAAHGVEELNTSALVTSALFNERKALTRKSTHQRRVRRCWSRATPELLIALRAMVGRKKKKGPKHFFMFNGKSSGLSVYSASPRLQSIPQGGDIGDGEPVLPAEVFHSKAGFTVAFWFRVDRSHNSSSPTQSSTNEGSSIPSGSSLHSRRSDAGISSSGLNSASNRLLPHVLFSVEGCSQRAQAAPWFIFDIYLDSALFLHSYSLRLVEGKVARHSHRRANGNDDARRALYQGVDTDLCVSFVHGQWAHMIVSVAPDKGKGLHDVQVFVDGSLQAEVELPLPATPDSSSFRLAFGRGATRRTLRPSSPEINGSPTAMSQPRGNREHTRAHRAHLNPDVRSGQDQVLLEMLSLHDQLSFEAQNRETLAEAAYYRQRSDMRGRMGNVLVFVGPVNSTAQAAELFYHQRDASRHGGAEVSDAQHIGWQRVGAVPTFSSFPGGRARPQSSRLGAVAAATAAALKTQFGRGLPARRAFSRPSSSQNHSSHSPFGHHNPDDLRLLVDRVVVELTPQLCSADGRLFISTTSLSPQQFRPAGKIHRNDLISQARQKLDQLTVFARRNLGTVASVLWNAAEIFNCMGGVRVLFPLFAQLNLRNPYAPRDGPDVVEPRLLLNTLDLMAAMLSQNPNNQKLMAQHCGFGVMSYVLRRISPQYLTVGCFQSIKRLLDAVQGVGGLEIAALRHLLFDLHLWKTANSQVQITVANFVVQFLSSLEPRQFHGGVARGQNAQGNVRYTCPDSGTASTPADAADGNSRHQLSSVCDAVEQLPCTNISDVLVNVYFYKSKAASVDVPSSQLFSNDMSPDQDAVGTATPTPLAATPETPTSDVFDTLTCNLRPLLLEALFRMMWYKVDRWHTDACESTARNEQSTTGFLDSQRALCQLFEFMRKHPHSADTEEYLLFVMRLLESPFKTAASVPGAAFCEFLGRASKGHALDLFFELLSSNNENVKARSLQVIAGLLRVCTRLDAWRKESKFSKISCSAVPSGWPTRPVVLEVASLTASDLAALPSYLHNCLLSRQLSHSLSGGDDATSAAEFVDALPGVAEASSDRSIPSPLEHEKRQRYSQNRTKSANTRVSEGIIGVVFSSMLGIAASSAPASRLGQALRLEKPQNSQFVSPTPGRSSSQAIGDPNDRRPRGLPSPVQPAALAFSPTSINTSDDTIDSDDASEVDVLSGPFDSTSDFRGNHESSLQDLSLQSEVAMSPFTRWASQEFFNRMGSYQSGTASSSAIGSSRRRPASGTDLLPSNHFPSRGVRRSDASRGRSESSRSQQKNQGLYLDGVLGQSLDGRHHKIENPIMLATFSALVVRSSLQTQARALCSLRCLLDSPTNCQLLSESEYGWQVWLWRVLRNAMDVVNCQCIEMTATASFADLKPPNTKHASSNADCVFGTEVSRLVLDILAVVHVDAIFHNDTDTSQQACELFESSLIMAQIMGVGAVGVDALALGACVCRILRQRITIHGNTPDEAVLGLNAGSQDSSPVHREQQSTPASSSSQQLTADDLPPSVRRSIVHTLCLLSDVALDDFASLRRSLSGCAKHQSGLMPVDSSGCSTTAPDQATTPHGIDSGGLTASGTRLDHTNDASELLANKQLPMTHAKLATLGITYAGMVGDIVALLDVLGSVGIVDERSASPPTARAASLANTKLGSGTPRSCHDFPVYFYRRDRVGLRLSLGCTEMYALATLHHCGRARPGNSFPFVAKAGLEGEFDQVAALVPLLGHCLRVSLRSGRGLTQLVGSGARQRRNSASSDDDDKRVR